MTDKLKNIKNKHLTENVLRALAQNRITTIRDILQEDVIKLTTITQLSLPQILDLRNDIFSKYSAPVRNGTTLLEASSKKSKLRTGFQSLDTILNGGIPRCSITEVCGLADSRKTQLCFQLAINCVRHSNNVVLYIDTKGDFSAVRIQKILESSGFSHEEMALLMYKIKVIRIWTLPELIEFFQKLKNGSIKIEELAAIIIDSLPCLMFQFLGDENKIGLTLLNTLVNYARFLSRELNIAVVCVNIQTRWIDQDISDLDEDEDQSTTSKENYIEKRNRCLGKYWRQIPSLVLLLERNQQKNNEPENQCLKEIHVSVLRSNVPELCDRKCIINLSALKI